MGLATMCIFLGRVRRSADSNQIADCIQPLIEHIIKKDPTYSSEMKANQLQARKEVKAKKSKVIEEEANLLAQALDKQQKMSNDTVLRERRLLLATYSSNGRTWIQPPQGSISRQTVPQIRVKARKVAYSLCMWKAVQC